MNARSFGNGSEQARFRARPAGLLRWAAVLAVVIGLSACSPLNREVILRVGQPRVQPGEVTTTPNSTVSMPVRVEVPYTFTSEQTDASANMTLHIGAGIPVGMQLGPDRESQTDLPKKEGGTLAFSLNLTGAIPQPGRYTVQLVAELCATGVDDLSTNGQKDTICERATAPFTVIVQAVGGSNLLLNPGFEQIVAAGGLPSLAGVWQGDATSTVPAENGITPHGGASMLKFVSTAQQASATLVSSQMWQIVDLQAWSTAIDAGGVSVDASAWFNRVTGGPNTDRRFDLRVLAFDTTDAGVPTRYQANSAMAVQAASVNTTGAAWQQASLSLVLPPQTRVVLVEIYAYEDVLNDAVAPEFDGHYADDVMLQLRLP